MIAFLEARRAGLYHYKNLYRNMLAGIIVAIVALPLSMAFAIASGVTPQNGIYTAIVAALCISIFGGCRAQIGGPTGAFIVILAGITAKYGIDGLQLAGLMAGIMLILMGVLRLGAVIQYIPRPVVLGFTAGIAVIIWVGQWKYFLGLQVQTQGLPFYQQVWLLLKGFPNLDWHTTVIAVLSLLILVLWPIFIKKIPAPLIAMVVATVVQTVFHFKSVATLGSTFGAFPRTLPMPHLLSIHWSEVGILMLPAFTIAMLGAIESLLSAMVADGMASTKHDSNQELIGQGIANMVSPLFGGFAATGAIARTATNIRNGGNSPVAGIVHSIVLILMILLLAPLATNIPLCSLAAVLFVVCYNMSEWRKFVLICKRAPYYDVLVLAVAFLLTVFVNLVAAVCIGVILASLLFMQRMAATFQVERMTEDDHAVAPSLSKRSVTFVLHGPLFFAEVTQFEEVMHNIHDQASEVVFDLQRVPFVDGSGLMALDEVVSRLPQHKVNVRFISANPRVIAKLKKARLLVNGACI